MHPMSSHPLARTRRSSSTTAKPCSLPPTASGVGSWRQIPYWAGYCSVLVNIHDIAAMGGKPIAMVDVFSMPKDTRIHEQVVRGMHDASAQFGVPIVGGHLHPDAPYSVIDVSILGSARLTQSFIPTPHR